ncbi:MAG: hypothetical protein HUU38_28125, partial [Anaerolineales bacterium]|nr:hypothetical protein [Anaerolineales bacterium]
MENRAGGVRGTVLAWGVGGVIFVALVWGLATFFKVRLLDFEHYLEAAKLIGQGQNPYGVVEFFAPPWFAWGMWPFLVLPEKYAVAVWVLLNLGAVSAATFLAIEWVQVSRPRMRLFLVGLTPIFLPGALFSYITGQGSPLVNLALLGAAWGVANGGTT